MGRIRIASTPKDTVVHVGARTKLDCSVIGLAEGDSLTWWAQTGGGGSSSRPIFVSHSASSSSVVLDVNKYEIQGQYNLVILKASMSDGGSYVCDVSGQRNHSAELVVTGLCEVILTLGV